MRSTTELRILWAEPCDSRNKKNLDHALRALDMVLEVWQYAPKEGQTWGYNCRRITGGTGYSLHAYGPAGLFTFWNGVRVTLSVAVDINSLANPYGPRLITDMPREMVEAILAIRTNGGHEVFGWGGNYRKNKDAMHYEVVCSPSELATGIDWRTVRSRVVKRSEEEPHMYPIFLKPGENISFHVEPTDSFVGKLEALLVLNTFGDANPVWVWNEAGIQQSISLNKFKPWTTRPKPGALDIRNDGKSDVMGSLLYKRV